MKKSVKSEDWTHPEYKIVRGVYLTGMGQEDEVYYFKIPRDSEVFSKIETGQVCLSFYQGTDILTAIPALVRIDSVLNASYLVQKALNKEKDQGFPLLPLIKIIDFDVLEFSKVMAACSQLQADIEKLSPLRYRQGELFDEV